MNAPHRIAMACVGLGACSLFGCQTLLDAPDYQVAAEQASPDLVDRLAAPAASAGCRDCLELGSCGEHLEACSSSPGCTEYAACMLDDPSPASEARCVTRLAPSEADRATANSLFDCHRRCVVDCGGGQDFSCAGAYTWPASAQNSIIRLTQSLSFLFEQRESSPVAGASITICPPGTHCNAPLEVDGMPLVVATDATGTYSVDVPISTEPASVAGFRGFRVVEGTEFATHRLQSNIPIFVDNARHTSILKREISDFIVDGLSQATDGAIDVVFVQVVDCREVGAGDMFLEFPSTPEATVYYKDDASPIALRTDGTLASQEGSAAIAGLEPGRFHRTIAKRRSGETVAETDIFVPGDQIVLFQIHPGGSE